MNKILLNANEYNIKESDLPYLITYKEKSGGSHFTITLLADLFNNGSKILFFTAFPMAKDNFLQQVGLNNSKITFVSSIEDFKNSLDFQAIILDSGNESLFIKALNEIIDIDERVVLVKNIEAFTSSVFDSCIDLDKIILSGNIDLCISKDKILMKKFKTIIAFNKTEIILPFEIPDLEKWTGYLSSTESKGVVKVKMN